MLWLLKSAGLRLFIPLVAILVAVTLAAMTLSVSVPASAKTAGADTSPAAPELSARRKSVARLDALFEKLRNAGSAEAATPLAAEIEQLFEHSGSTTADLLYARAKQAMEAKDFDQALDLLDYVTLLNPGWAEPYHRRAIVHFVRQDYDAAFRDIRETLAREPRHFHALAGLGGILRGQGDKKGAFRAFSKALEINPNFPDLRESLEKLRVDAEGQPI
jgi:tetratricopeptide (TPR) repeat protein